MDFVPAKYKMRIEKITQETKDSKSFMLVPEGFDDGLYSYLPGQFFILEFEVTRPKTFAYDRGKKMLVGSDEPVKVLDRRAFSIASSPAEKSFIELLVKSEGGAFVPYFLEQARAGDVCTLTGPQGRFMNGIFQNREKLVACWSSGSGIPSTISLMKYVLDKELGTKIIVFDSNKTAEDIIFHERIKKLVNESENFKAVFTSTRESKAPASGNPNIVYKTGRFWLNENTLEKHDGIGWKNFYNTICGSSSFINGKTRDENGIVKTGDGIEDNLLKAGVPQSRIDKDQFYIQ